MEKIVKIVFFCFPFLTETTLKADIVFPGSRGGRPVRDGKIACIFLQNR